MDKEKKQIRDTHLNNLMKRWLLVIPIIVGIIGAGTTIALWLAVRAEFAPVETSLHVNSVDKVLLASIRSDFRRTYLQYLQARINPSDESERVERLEQKLSNIAQEEEKIILKYNPEYASILPSSLKILLGTLAMLPGPIMYTLCLVNGLLFFMITRAIAFSIIKRRYSLDDDSDYVREA